MMEIITLAAIVVVAGYIRRQGRKMRAQPFHPYAHRLRDERATQWGRYGR